MLIWALTYPARLAFFTVCCAVPRQKLQRAADVDAAADEEVQAWLLYLSWKSCAITLLSLTCVSSIVLDIRAAS